MSSSELDAKVSQLIEDYKKEGLRCECTDCEGSTLINIELANGQRPQALSFFLDHESLDSLLSMEIHKYKHIGDYRAIANYERQYIEAALTIPGVAPSSHTSWTIALNTKSRKDDGDSWPSAITIASGGSAPNCEIVIGPYSEVFCRIFDEELTQRAIKFSIQISGVPFVNQEDAIRKLESIANSLFFQIDLVRRQSLALQREPTRVPPFSSRRGGDEWPAIEFPRTEYDAAPLALYWYGRSSREMPLLKYLAYYQCIEFYFPTYYHVELKRRVQNVLKNPVFRVDREADIARVLAAASPSAHRGPKERDMLRATLRECVDAAALREYVEESVERVKWFSTNAKGLTDKKLPVRDVDADLRDSVADRIYDIRCRIVHTKSGGDDDVELLLPDSKEARQLHEDIALIELVAQNVLIAASSPLKLSG